MNNHKHSREYLEHQLTNGRYSLLILMIFTVVNIVLLLVEVNRYFVCSITISYYLCALGQFQDVNLDFTVAVIISALILAVYLGCWVMSRKRPVWLYAALALFVIDSAVLVWIVMKAETLPDSIVDLVIHAMLIWELFQGARCGMKLSQLPADAPVTGKTYTGVMTGADYLKGSSDDTVQ